MAAGGARGGSAGVMLTGTALVLVALLLVSDAVVRLQRQAAELDPSETRAQPAFVQMGWGFVAGGLGVLLYLVAGIVYAVSASRARRQAAPDAKGARVVALASTFALVAVLVFAGFSPEGPVLQGASFLAGGGGAADAVQVVVFEGELTGATVAGQTTDENVHPFAPVAKSGAIRVRIGSGGQGFEAVAIAILEAQEPGGAWREIARTDPVPDSTVDVPEATYEGPLRLRVQVAGAGTIRYMMGVSFTPAGSQVA